MQSALPWSMVPRPHPPLLSVPDLAGFKDVFAGKADVGDGCGKSILARNTFWSSDRNFPACLGRIVLVGEPAFCSVSAVFLRRCISLGNQGYLASDRA